MKQTLREYLPAFFGEIRELRVLLDCFESELLLLEQTLTQQIANQFLYGGSMDEAGVNRWQQALRLELPGMAAEDKLFEIKSRMLEQRPYNRRQWVLFIRQSGGKNRCGQAGAVSKKSIQQRACPARAGAARSYGHFGQ